MIPKAGFELAECWPLITRPDWIISLAVKAGALTYERARFVIVKVLTDHALALDDTATLGALSDLRESPMTRLSKLRAIVADGAYVAIAVMKDTDLAHRLNSVGQLITAEQARSAGHADVALTRLQGAAFSLGLSLSHTVASERIKELMFAFHAQDAREEKQVQAVRSGVPL